MVAALVAGVLFAIVFAFALFYLVTRLRFAYFHSLIHNVRLIRPGWHMYRDQATRFFWMNLGVGVCLMFLIALILLPFAAGFFAMFHNLAAGIRPDLAQILTLVLPLIPILFFFVLIAIAVDVLLRDLMLPHYALENATAGGAWRAVRVRIQAEKGAFFRYALVRVFLPIVAMIGLGILFIIPAVLFAAIVAVIEIGIRAGFSDAAGAISVMGVALQAIVGLAAFCVAAIVGISVAGPVCTAIREYALCFYGGRFQTLGDILAPRATAAGAS